MIKLYKCNYIHLCNFNCRKFTMKLLLLPTYHVYASENSLTYLIFSLCSHNFGPTSTIFTLG
uniref:Putative ovule protein n=1 Tax=Solanum chacoense TaxID=4108 RepID=A0A0V0HCW7_SOLCH